MSNNNKTFCTEVENKTLGIISYVIQYTFHLLKFNIQEDNYLDFRICLRDLRVGIYFSRCNAINANNFMFQSFNTSENYNRRHLSQKIHTLQ